MGQGARAPFLSLSFESPTVCLTRTGLRMQQFRMYLRLVCAISLKRTHLQGEGGVEVSAAAREEKQRRSVNYIAPHHVATHSGRGRSSRSADEG